MSLAEDVWKLPSPAAFVREIARIAQVGQHVLAVLPRHIATRAEYSDALAAAIGQELDGFSRRVYPTPSQGALVAALGFNMTEDFDNAPVTVPALLTHPDIIGRIFICDVSDLLDDHRSELPSFFERLDAESKSIGSSERGTLIFVVTQEFARKDDSSVALVNHWYWDRVARWDVAALLALHDQPQEVGILSETRLETIIEIAKWDLELAVELAREWDGSESALEDRLGIAETRSAQNRTLRRGSNKYPPDSLIEEWDVGAIDSWHGLPTINPSLIVREPENLSRLIWSAQSRVLLPWIELRRTLVEQIVRQKLGTVRMLAAVDEYSTRYPGVEFDPTLIEVSTLLRIISARFGSSEARLRTTVQSLSSARNRLAHLKPLPHAELLELSQKCAWLN
jgi:hypothetical protein